jgi:hypothetical protein
MPLRRRKYSRWVAGVAAIGVAVGAFVVAVTSAGPASAAIDLAAGRAASADSTEAGHGAALANDTNAATRWCAADGNAGHWWQVDLGSAAAVTGTQIRWEFARVYKYRIAVSTNATTWTTVSDRSANTTSAQDQADSFTANARYVRITVTGLAAGTWASMFSFAVLGTAISPSPSGSASPTSSAGPTGSPGPTSSPGPSSSASPATAPFKGVANSACDDLATLTISWYYNWGLDPGKCVAPGFVPMISGKNEKTAAAVTSALKQVATAGYRTVLGFNEPNKADQSNLTVAQAIALWPQLSANPDVLVGSPATSADGQAWLKDFLSQADAANLRVDFLALHWYGWSAGSCDAKALTLEYYINWAEKLPGNRPIWITELGCMNQSNPDRTTVEAFYAGALAMFARHPRVVRYAWYPWLTNNELVSNNALTPLGQALAKAPAYH